jgi:hypothetical protein
MTLISCKVKDHNLIVLQYLLGQNHSERDVNKITSLSYCTRVFGFVDIYRRKYPIIIS